jgi:hypothetical protein
MHEIKSKYEQIISYLKDLLSNRERHELEKDAMRDAFEEDAFEGLTQLSAGELESDMDILMNRLEKRIKPVKKRNLLPYYRIAASVVLLIGIGSILYFVFRTPSRNLIPEETSKIKIPVPAKTESVAVKDTPLIAENKSTKTRIKQQTAQVLPENHKESEAESESAFKMAAPKAYVLEEDEKIYNESKAPLEEVAVVGYNKQKKADDTGAVSATEANEITPAGHAVPYSFVKPIPPDGSLKAFKNRVNELIDTVQFKAFPGKYKIYIVFTVQTDGTIRDIQIKNTIPSAMAEEYKRVITQSPSWKPAMQDNIPVEAQVEVSFIKTIK